MTSSDPTRSWSITVITTSVSSGKDTVNSNTLKETAKHAETSDSQSSQSAFKRVEGEISTDSPNEGLSCFGMYRSLVSRNCCPMRTNRYGSDLPFRSVGVRLVACRAKRQQNCQMFGNPRANHSLRSKLRDLDDIYSDQNFDCSICGDSFGDLTADVLFLFLIDGIDQEGALRVESMD